jgi:hypothetical protein
VNRSSLGGALPALPLESRTNGDELLKDYIIFPGVSIVRMTALRCSSSSVLPQQIFFAALLLLLLLQSVKKNSKVLVMCAVGGTLDTNVSYRRDKKLFAGERRIRCLSF